MKAKRRKKKEQWPKRTRLGNYSRWDKQKQSTKRSKEADTKVIPTLYCTEGTPKLKECHGILSLARQGVLSPLSYHSFGLPCNIVVLQSSSPIYCFLKDSNKVITHTRTIRKSLLACHLFTLPNTTSLPCSVLRNATKQRLSFYLGWLRGILGRKNKENRGRLVSLIISFVGKRWFGQLK